MNELEGFKVKKNNDILHSMIDYMNYEDEAHNKNFDCGYKKEDIDYCGEILDAYIDELALANQDESKIMESVKRVVIVLN